MSNGANVIQDLVLHPDGSYGLGCGCSQLQKISSNDGIFGLVRAEQLGAVNDYDTIRVGGGTYTANQILDKTIRANRETKLYSNPSGKGTVVGTVKAGENIGKVQSYLRASNKSTDGRSWLQFDRIPYVDYRDSFYVPNENISSVGLKDQGTLTITEEKKEEDDAKLKDESPVEYYIRKYAIKGIVVIGLIVVASTVGKQLIHEGFSKIGSSKPAPALAGVKKKKRTTKRKK